MSTRTAKPAAALDLAPLKKIQARSKQLANGCVIWTGAAAANGYGSIYVGGKSRSAHRYVYEAANGAVPAGLYVCHHCDTRRCIRLDHLFLGTHRDNMQDMLTKGRAAHQQLTTCKDGHPLDGLNWIGNRMCTICDRAKKLRYYHRNKDTINATRRTS